MNDKEQDKEFMKELADKLIVALRIKFGYCGVAKCETAIMLNSGKTNLIINIELKD